MLLMFGANLAVQKLLRRQQRKRPGPPRISPSDSGLMDGGVYGTRTRGLRRDRQAKGLAAGGSTSHPPGIIGHRTDPIGKPSPGLAGFRPPRVTLELQSRPGCPDLNDPSHLLTVREVATALRVKCVTVYKLCREGKLAHARVSNAIRVLESVVARYLDGPPAAANSGDAPGAAGLRPETGTKP